MSERGRDRGKERWKQEKRERKKRRKNRQQLEKQQNVSRRKKREVAAWEKLDNTANLFPAIATQNMTNVYRISVTLSEHIERELLQQALDEVLPVFDTFRVRMRKGLFWNYFETNYKAPPLVELEDKYLLSPKDLCTINNLDDLMKINIPAVTLNPMKITVICSG